MGMPPPIDLRIRTQNPRDYTVQIRHAQTGAIVGTGVVVSPDKIVTCAHVVVVAGVNPRKDQPIPTPWAQFLETILHRKPETPSDHVGVYFPQVRTDEKKERRAQVAAYFADYDDDIVLLQLVGEAAPLGPEQIATIGTAEKSDEHEFRSYGYRRLDNYLAGWADGKIQGCVESPVGRRVQVEPIQIVSNQINRGMSGAGVLDTIRNLVIGIISETWLPDDPALRDGGTSWAVNARVLTFPPFGLDVRDESLPLRAAPQPKTDAAEARAAVAPIDRFAWNSAPVVLDEWTGRDDLLEKITQDWLDPNKHVTGLIGFGGEGKSSLARKWVDTICKGEAFSARARAENASPLPTTPDGVFWWGFYENRSVDEFLEAALKWITGGGIDPRKIQSSNARAQIIGAMLSAGRYLFVLDGLEVMQHQEGDRFGLLQSNDLRDLLTYFARPDNQSFCLVTSRAPLLDLMEYTTYTHRDVDRLSAADGRALLRKLGVQGKDDALDKLVADWDGHALTLSLLAAILTERYGGDMAHAAEIPLPTTDEKPVLSVAEGRYERVHRVLRRYDEHLTDAEREFLKLFSAFRTPVHESAFDKVFLPMLNLTTAHTESEVEKIENSASSAVSSVKSLAIRLVKYRLLRSDLSRQTYTAHPLIRSFYEQQLEANDKRLIATIHLNISDYYRSHAIKITRDTKSEDLINLVELIHHLCQAGEYERALIAYGDLQEDHRTLVWELGAWETDLKILREFFPNGDINQDPLVSSLELQRWLLNNVGLSLSSAGNLIQAVPLYVRKNVIAETLKDWVNASIGYHNLALVYSELGLLAAGLTAADRAIDFARNANHRFYESVGLAYKGRLLHLSGQLTEATEVFKEARNRQKNSEGSNQLFSDRGVFYADHLRRIGRLRVAAEIASLNLSICERNHWVQDVSRNLRILADIESNKNNVGRARTNYDEALKIARTISFKPSLIEALLGRGRLYACQLRDVSAAFSDLQEALDLATFGGYRIYECDIRVVLTWTHLANDDKEKATAEAEHVLRMSEEMGYYWGKVDAEEVLAVIRGQGAEVSSQ